MSQVTIRDRFSDSIPDNDNRCLDLMDEKQFNPGILRFQKSELGFFEYVWYPRPYDGPSEVNRIIGLYTPRIPDVECRWGKWY
jgi:hypothetical protein